MRRSPRRPSRGRPTSTAPSGWRRRPSPRGGARRPRSAASRSSGSPTPLEARAEDLVRAESENTGKPFQLTMDEEIPPMVDQIRFFAGAARHLEGLAAAEYMAGHTSFIRREPIGVCGAVTPWNYPMMMAVWKFAPALAAGNTMVLKPSDTTPGHRAADGRDHGRAPPARRLQRGLRRPRHRPGPGGARHAGHGVGDRFGAGRHGGRGGGGPHPQAGAPRAGRQGSGHRLRRRRPGGGGRRDRRRGLLQRGAGLHRGHPGAGRARGCTRTCWPPWSSRPRGRRSAAPTTRTPTTGR